MSHHGPQVILDYFDSINTENWDKLAALWTDDAELDVVGARPRRGREDVLTYLDHLRRSGLAPSSRRVYQTGISFLFRVTLQRPEVVADLLRPKVLRKKARVLKGSEVQRLLEAMPSPKHRYSR